jgi:hypothetical protein
VPISRIAVASALAVCAFVTGGGLGSILTDRRLGEYIRESGVHNAIWYSDRAYLALAALKRGDNVAAKAEMQRILNAEQVLLQACIEAECPDDLKSKAQAVLEREF